MRYVVFLAILFTLFSCNRNADQSADISPIKLIRFDKDLRAFDTNQFEQSDEIMIKKYGELYSFYIEDLMGLGKQSPKTDEDYYQKYIPRFLSGEYPAMMDSCEKYVIKDIDKIEKSITESYANLIGLFPEKKPSKVFSFFISPMGANPQAAFSYGNDTIGINWFNYLGRDFGLYKPIYEGYTYMIEWNSQEYIPRNIMLVEYNLLKEKHKTNEELSELIYKMIEEGKKMYFLDLVCKQIPEHTKIGYNEAQLKWCRENEFEIWAYFKENKLLYSLDNLEAKRYTEEGPSTPGMPQGSPGMVGTWTGWQIVKKYMSSHHIPMSKLMEMSPKEIFKNSEYKPEK